MGHDASDHASPALKPRGSAGLELGLGILIALAASGCATPRSHSIFGLQFSDQPPRVAIRSECNGQIFSTQGVVVCEQKQPSQAKVSVKVPPLEGRVVYSNGQLKKTQDFNWYPKEGFFIWGKKPVKDTWVDLDLGEINATFGDWPVALDVTAVSPVGIVNTRGILYHRICNDQDLPCSRLVVEFDCAGFHKATAAGQIEKCVRLSGSGQAFSVKLAGPGYQATAGARVYLSVPRLGIERAIPVGKPELEAGAVKIETQELPTGPTLVLIRLAYLDASNKTVNVETRILLVGHDPAWTGLDQPHYMSKDDHIDWVRPVLSDLMEVTTYNAGEMKARQFSSSQMMSGIQAPKDSEVSCAFAWARESSDLSIVCLNSQLSEVPLP
jgi:hypothetical protein